MKIDHQKSGKKNTSISNTQIMSIQIMQQAWTSDATNHCTKQAGKITQAYINKHYNNMSRQKERKNENIIINQN
jgi:hypothetical protein